MALGHEAVKGTLLSKERIDHLDSIVLTWVNEYLSHDDREAFMSAYEAGRFVEAHTLLMLHGIYFPSRRKQWDEWLALNTAV